MAVIVLVMDKKELAKRIAEMALLRGEFTLRSGRKSNYYLDKYLFSTEPGVLRELGEMFADRVGENVDVLAGTELGGIPLVAAASLASGVRCVFIRNQKKGYGTGRQLEGKLGEGDGVMLVEDVLTTGGQILEAAKVVENEGARVVKIVGTIDREEGARKNIEGAGYVYECLFTKSELGV